MWKETRDYMAQQLKRIREEQNVTQEQLAQQAGTFQSNIHKIENGGGGSIDTFSKLFGLLGYEIKLNVVEKKVE